MPAAWAKHQEEYAAGIADSIEKDFAEVHRLYTGTPGGPPRRSRFERTADLRW